MEFSDYDDGFRRGVFDRCNGRPCLIKSPGDGSLWDSGYLDGWNGNEQRIDPNAVEGESEDDRLDRLGQAAYDAGQTLVPAVHKMVEELAKQHPTFEQDIWQGLYDGI